MMSTESVGIAVEERWSAALTCPCDGFIGGSVDLEHIVPIDGETGHVISGGANSSNIFYPLMLPVAAFPYRTDCFHKQKRRVVPKQPRD